MVIPEHAQVPHTNGRHKGADHLVELTSGRPKNPAKSRVPHVKERLYSRIVRRVLLLSLFCFAVRPIFGH